MRPDEFDGLVIARLIHELKQPNQTPQNNSNNFDFKEDPSSGIRVERFNTKALFVYKHGKLIQLISDDTNTIRDFFLIRQKFPVRSIDRCFSALIVGILLEHGLMDKRQKNRHNFEKLVKNIINAEKLINHTILKKIEQNDSNLPREKLDFLENFSNIIFQSESAEKQSQQVANQELGINWSELPTFLLKSCRASQSELEQSKTTLIPTILYVALFDYIVSELKNLRKSREFTTAQWGKAISLMLGELHTNRAYWRPHRPVPDSQLALVERLMVTSEQDKPSSSSDIDQSSRKNIILANNPDLDTSIALLRAVYPNSHDSQANHADEATSLPILSLHEWTAFYYQFFSYLSNTVARSVYPAIDTIPLLVSSLFSSNMSSPLSERFEQSLLLKAIHDHHLTIDPKSHCHAAFTPWSNRALYELLQPRRLEDIGHAIKNAAHSLAYIISASLMSSWQTIEEASAIYQKDKTVAINVRVKKRIHDKLVKMANKLLQDLKESGGELFNNTGYKNQINEIIRKLKNNNNNNNNIELETLSAYFLALELIKAEMTLAYSAEKIEPWELHDEPGITSVFPAELCREFNNYLLHTLYHHRFATLFSTSIALAGFCQVPYLKEAVSELNHALTGKSFSETGMLALSNMMMGMLAFKIALMGSSMVYLRDSLFMELLGFIQRDPWKVVLAAGLIYGLGTGLISHPAIQATLFLSCDVRLSKTGLLFIYEMCVKELYEADKLADFPYLEWALVIAKVTMVLHSLVTKDPLRMPLPLNAMSLDAEPAWHLINTLIGGRFPAHNNNNNQNPLLYLTQMALYDKFNERKDLAWYLHLLNALPKDLNQSAIQKTLYQALIRPKLPIAANFVYQVAMAISHMTAFTLTPLRFLNKPYRDKFFADDNRNFTTILVTVSQYVANVVLLSAFIYWVHIYDSRAAYSHAISQDISHDAAHEHKLSTDECLSLNADEALHEYHHLVHTCFNQLLQCKLHHTPAFFVILTNVLKWLGTVLIAINGILLVKNWDQAFSIEGRRQSYDSLSGEAYRGILSLLQSLYVFIYYCASLLDLGLTTSRDLSMWTREKITGYARQDAPTSLSEIQACRDALNTGLGDNLPCFMHRLFSPSTRLDNHETADQLMGELLSPTTPSHV
jgi:hypothetical protein